MTEPHAALAEDLAQLAVLHDREPDAALLTGLRAVGFPGNLGLRLTSEAARAAGALFSGYFAELETSREELDRLAVDYAEIYLTHALRAAPTESPWLDEDGLERQEPMFQVRAAYRRHGLAVPDRARRPDDHIVHQLQFLAHLVEKGNLGEACRFLDDHPLRWIESFAKRVVERAATPYFAGLALLTAAYLSELRSLLAGLDEAGSANGADESD